MTRGTTLSFWSYPNEPQAGEPINKAQCVELHALLAYGVAEQKKERKVPQSVEELIEILSVTEREGDVFTGRQPTEARLARVFGGQVISQALRAAMQTVPLERNVHSLHVYFVLGGDPTVPIRYEVTRVRDGGSFTTRKISAIQHDREICMVMASFQRTESGFEHSLVPSGFENPDMLPSVGDVLRARGGVDADFWEHEWAALDMRVGTPVQIDGRAQGQRIWFKVREAMASEQSLHRGALAYMTDLTLLSAALVPHGYFIGDAQVQRASLDHAIWFHDDVDINEWLLYDQQSSWAGGGRGLARAEIYDRAGRLIASVAQEGLIRPRDRGEDRLIRPNSA